MKRRRHAGRLGQDDKQHDAILELQHKEINRLRARIRELEAEKKSIRQGEGPMVGGWKMIHPAYQTGEVDKTEPTDTQIEAATEAIHRVNEKTTGLRYSDLVREMAKAALTAAQSLPPPPDKNPVVTDGSKAGHGDEPPTRGAVAPTTDAQIEAAEKALEEIVSDDELPWSSRRAAIAVLKAVAAVR
jgi:hypothetical protein